MLMTYNFWDAFDRAFFEETPWATAEEREQDYVLTAELPGIADKDIQLTVNHDSVTLAVTREPQKAPEGYKVHRKERGAFQFSRTFQLPRHVDTEKVSAELKDGVLTITAPKAETAKPRKIEVRGMGA